MFSLKRPYYLLVVLALLLTSCNKEFAQVQKSQDSNLKYDYAQKSFKEGNYRRALNLFEEIQPFMRGKDQFEEMTYTMAYAYYYSKDYFMASHVFSNYTRLYPNTDRVEECFFMSAFCKMLDVPYYKLDQSSALEAIKMFQLFINYYPRSERVKDANDYIDAMRLQLAKKSYDLANNYYRRRLYNSASIAFKNVMKEFPETEYREKAMLMNVKSLYYYAYHSTARRQLERYQNVVSAYEVFERAFPESTYMKEAQKYLKNTNNQLSKFDE